MVPGIGAYEAPRAHRDAPADWLALLDHWRVVITRLAGDFAQGRAELDPKSRNATCSRCHLAMLCRIHERDESPVNEAPADG